MGWTMDRRGFVAACAAAGMPLDMGHRLWAVAVPAAAGDGVQVVDPITKDQIASAEAVLGLSFRDSDRDLMVRNLNSALQTYIRLHAVPLTNAVPPAFHFDPIPVGKVAVPQPVSRRRSPRATGSVARPSTDVDLAYAGVATLSRMIRARAVTSRRLVELSLARIEQYTATLLCVITPTRDRALEQADRMDAEARRGKFRGPLHGIPYGAKDLFAVPKYPTTWGSPIYRDQVLDVTAAVVERLDTAGAVLVAKTSLGEFAQDDVWFGGQTRNPWNTDKGSSGSSAGSAAGVSAGLYPFALGTETLGSIVAPSTRCGVSGLRPTYGRVSRYGAMALSWTMDKAGAITRSAEDLALVFAALHGADPRDPSSRTLPFAFEPDVPLSRLRIGALPTLLVAPAADANPRAKASHAAAMLVVDALRQQGAAVKPVTWPSDPPAGALQFLLEVEAAAAFDEVTRNNTVDQMVLQDAGAWPNTFRSAHLVSAPDYVQANRARTLLINKLDEMFADFDVVIAPGTGGNTLAATNLSGHPQVCVPVSVDDQGTWQSVSFIAALWREDVALRLAHAWQSVNHANLQRPPKFA
jgi:Asp-tRNA(Asn)/Glu-tRNA(Gln) amidotransferase A subunit family amidase